jgi:hypothetical protein
MKQTAVEWLQQALEDTILTHEQIMQTTGLFEQAKDIDAERAYDIYEKWFWDNLPSKSSSEGKLSQKEFYNRYFKMKQTAVEWLRDLYENQPAYDESILDEQWQKALEMEKANHEKFNKFLNDEKQLGISDLKTIERIQWYYNTYFNETFNTNEK